MNEAAESWFADALEASGFLRKHPQFAGLVAELEPMGTSQIAIMAIARHWRADGRVVLRLYVNRQWLATHPEWFAGVLQHEMHHVLCGHVDDPRFHAVAEPRWMEIAMEFAANEHIVAPMPPGFVWQAFEEFGMRANQSTHERYELLVEAARSGRLRLMDEDELDRLMPGWRERCKSGRGTRVVVMPKRGLLPWNNRPRVIDATIADEHRPGECVDDGGRGLGDALDRSVDRAMSRTWSDGRWMLGAPTGAKQIAAWQLRIRAHLRQTIGGDGDCAAPRGVASKELPRQVANVQGSTMLAWPTILRAALRSSRTVFPDHLRPNRRFPERIGELPGRVRRRRPPRLLVGLDTSASMDAAALSAAIAEVRRLAQHAHVTIAEADATVHRVHRDLRVEIVTGGGDTDFHPLFSLAADTTEFDGVVYATDGVGAWPDVAPAVPVVWLLTTDRAFDCPWGTVVRLPMRRLAT